MPSSSNPSQRTETNVAQSPDEIESAVLEFRQKQGYHVLLNRLTNYFQKLIDDIFRQYPHQITFPMDTKPMEHFLLGFEIEYCSLEELINSPIIPHFCNPFDPEGKDPSPHYLEGFWFPDESMKRVYIFVKTSSNANRQIFTKIHELFHFCQSLDMAFVKLLEKIITESTLPSDLVRRLIERSANKATAMYLIPEEHLRKKYQETKSAGELARFYGVSQKTLEIRLEECGIINSHHNPLDTL